MLQELSIDYKLNLTTPVLIKFSGENVNGKLPSSKDDKLVLSCMPTANDWSRLPGNSERTSEDTLGLNRREPVMRKEGEEGLRGSGTCPIHRSSLS